jgi:16S rRNA (guanine1516-N2)-methyltransferase
MTGTCSQCARRLGEELIASGLATTGDSPPGSLELTCGPEGLTLTARGAGEGLNLHLDFVRGPQGYRLAHAGQSREDLVRALGRLPAGSTVLDASTGLGRDSLLLAARGFQVIALERHPVLAALLTEALERAGDHPALQPLIARIDFEQADARAWLNKNDTRFDAAIFDPMFPPRSKDAAVKKEMQVLHRLLGPDADPDALETLETLRNRVRRCVVVKRPLHAPHLGTQPPSRTLRGRSTRFDVYLPTNNTQG